MSGSIHSDGFPEHVMRYGQAFFILFSFLLPGLICPRPTATEAIVEAMFVNKRLEIRVDDMEDMMKCVGCSVTCHCQLETVENPRKHS